MARLLPNGLCPDCAATDATAEPTPPVSVPSGSTLFAPTHTSPPVDSTATGYPPGSTAAPLPNAPPGYDFLDRLGSGGMGSVYLAREHSAERLVAMKFLHHPGNPDAFDRFLVELRVLAQLDHPNIVRVLASDFMRADPFFTMEYMSGGSLSRALDTSTPVPVADAVRLIRTVAEAVTAAHAKGIIHRDLKPSNILLAADGTPKVSDFGLAKRLEADDPSTRVSGALGTASYMPPEQVSRKNGEIGPWSDVYGLGATLYHLLAGRAPFVGDTSEGIILQVLVEPPPRLRPLRPDVPLELEGIVWKCLEKDPQDRYQSMAELVADLNRFAAGQKPVAPPLTRVRRAKQWVRRHRRGVLAAVLAISVVVGAFTLGAAYWHQPTELAGTTVEPSPPPSPPPPAPDPVKEIQAALAAGKTVTLIGEKGLPRRHMWRLTPSVLAESPVPDAACAFQSNDATLLELLPDPGVPRYRFSVEIRQLRRVDAIQPDNSLGTDHVGVYFGAETREISERRRVTTLVGAVFRDVARQAQGIPPLPSYAHAEGGVILETPENLPRHFTASQGKAVKFDPAQRWPGLWRKFIVDVTPDLVEIWFSDEKMQPVLLCSWTGDQLRGWYAGFAAKIDTHAPGHGLAPPPTWHPRMALGIWCNQSSVALRNVTIGPIPGDKGKATKSP